MDISKKEQTQTAGDFALQNQFENLNNCNVTINDKDLIRAIATEVCSKEMLNVYRTCTQDAIELANKRDNMFAQIFIPRIERIESSIESLKDPSFQFMIQDARETAVKTDREEDWQLLSELLSYHVLKGDDKKIDAGISHAIKIVDEIDNDALCALTTACAFEWYSAITGSIRKGLSVLNDLYEKLLYLELPKGVGWLDHLDMLGAVRISSFNLIKSKEYICSYYEGYACVGLLKGSEEIIKAYKILDDNHISHDVLENNDCIDGYLRLSYSKLSNVRSECKDIVLQILNLYSKDKSLIEKAKNGFIELWDSYDNLRIIREWWDQIPKGFEVSYIGRVLAQTNAKRVYPLSPDII